MHYSKALWGDDAYEFRPERWEHGAPHRRGLTHDYTCSNHSDGTLRMAVSTKEHDQAVPYFQIDPNGFNGINGYIDVCSAWLGQCVWPSVAIRVHYAMIYQYI